MITSILASVSSFICTIGRELNERGMLASVLYAVFAVALPYLASKLGVRGKKESADAQDDAKTDNGAAVAVFALVACVFGCAVTAHCGVAGCVAGLAVVGCCSAVILVRLHSKNAFLPGENGTLS